MRSHCIDEDDSRMLFLVTIEGVVPIVANSEEEAQYIALDRLRELEEDSCIDAIANDISQVDNRQLKGICNEFTIPYSKDYFDGTSKHYALAKWIEHSRAVLANKEHNAKFAEAQLPLALFEKRE